MLFNSASFALFLPVVFFLYWFVFRERLRQQNLLLLFASYFFYGCWDYRFLFLLVFSTFLDYFTGIRIEDASSRRTKRAWLWTSIIINLGFLAVFKYYNFFTGSLSTLVSHAGVQWHFRTIEVILPVGISFYTFHGLSYVIDISRGKISATRNFVDYSVFVSFFPLLVAGPIERATHLLPQIRQPRQFNSAQAVDGLRQILWGLFKKMVIADNCAEFANTIFNNYTHYSGATLLLGALLFTFQIYCDFSGYSDIALGTARLFGIELLRNFAFPYFSRDIAEFWRRWHISLSSWFKDYLYIPLGGSRTGKWEKIRNTFIIFLVSGFWHGANWTFIAWGALNALYFIPLLLLNKNRDHIGIVAQGRAFPSVKELLQITTTFALTVYAWIFFRAAGLHDAWRYSRSMFSGLFNPLSYRQAAHFISHSIGWALPLLLTGFLIAEWVGREHRYAIEHFGSRWTRPLRWSFYYLLIFFTFYFAGGQQQFIYFQF